MRKIVATGLAALCVTSFSLAAHAQQKAAPIQAVSSADWNALTDARIGVIKAALQLNPDQQKYWPAIEDAIRSRSEMRQHRSAALVARLDEPKGEIQPIDLMRARAEALGQRSESMKKLADAWQPLYATLDTDQKRRMAFLVVNVLSDVRGAVERRRSMQDEDDD